MKHVWIRAAKIVHSSSVAAKASSEIVSQIGCENKEKAFDECEACDGKVAVEQP